jgi:hypothetical protein
MLSRTPLAALAGILVSGAVAHAQPSALGCDARTLVIPRVLTANVAGLPNGLSQDQVISDFAADGVGLTWSPASSPVLIIDFGQDYGGQGARTDSDLQAVNARNLIKQANGEPVSYTLTFAQPVAAVGFYRAPLHAGPSGVTNPVWTAVALGDDGATVASTGEAEIRSFVDVPSRRFILSGARRIKSVTFSGDDHNFDGQANVVLETLAWCP